MGKKTALEEGRGITRRTREAKRVLGLNMKKQGVSQSPKKTLGDVEAEKSRLKSLVYTFVSPMGTSQDHAYSAEGHTGV